MTENKNSDINTLTFEQAMEELEGIVSRLESGDIALEESLAIYQRGNLLQRHCEEKLKDATAKIEAISKDGTQLFDESE